jgi:hypothetical protein
MPQAETLGEISVEEANPLLYTVKGSNRSVLQLTKASLSVYIDREKRREKEESSIRNG